jgi:hypothetical protein
MEKVIKNHDVIKQQSLARPSSSSNERGLYRPLLNKPQLEKQHLLNNCHLPPLISLDTICYAFQISHQDTMI